MIWLRDTLALAGFMSVCWAVFLWLAHGSEIFALVVAFAVAGGIELMAMVTQ